MNEWMRYELVLYLFDNVAELFYKTIFKQNATQTKMSTFIKFSWLKRI